MDHPKNQPRMVWEKLDFQGIYILFENMGTPKWMVKIMEILIKMDDLGVPLFSGRVFLSMKSTPRFLEKFSSGFR